MNIYLPIAEVSVNALILLGLGGGVGFLSGIFGVGGGFLMTPLLIFIGVYQVPMFLTPIAMRWLYAPRPDSKAAN